MNVYKLRQEMNIDGFYEYLFVFNNITLRFSASGGEINSLPYQVTEDNLSGTHEVII